MRLPSLQADVSACPAAAPNRRLKTGGGMIYLVSGSIASIREKVAEGFGPYLGFLTAPKNGNSIAAIESLGIPFAADNGAFSDFNEDAFARMLTRLQGSRCMWVAAPDVVGDARATLEKFHWWALWIRRHGLSVAFVGQDGLETLPVPWDDFEAYFIGGSTEWKLSQASADLAAEARRRGKWVHMGRVNSLRRLRAAWDMGCDSCDGSSASKWGDKFIHQYCRWLQALAEQRTFAAERRK